MIDVGGLLARAHLGAQPGRAARGAYPLGRVVHRQGEIMVKAFSVSIDVAVTPDEAWMVIGDPCAVPYVWFFPHCIKVKVGPNE